MECWGIPACTEKRFQEIAATHHLNCAVEFGSVSLGKPTLKTLLVELRYRCQHPEEQFGSFERGASFVQECIQQEGVCVVSCARGRSRSVAMVLFFLMAHRQNSLRDAFKHLKSLRPMIGPSRHLQPQLVAAERRLRGGVSSMSQDEPWKHQIGIIKAPPKELSPLLKNIIDRNHANWEKRFGDGDEAIRVARARKRDFLLQYGGLELEYAKTLFL